MDTTSAYLLGLSFSIRLARSMEMMPAEQPIPGTEKQDTLSATLNLITWLVCLLCLTALTFV